MRNMVNVQKLTIVYWDHVSPYLFFGPFGTIGSGAPLEFCPSFGRITGCDSWAGGGIGR